ncbi:MAG: hypothetical protein K5849_01985 [Bacteroidales bacterium]|nr:hypothetical protein [Bacteroidales bacterium]
MRPTTRSPSRTSQSLRLQYLSGATRVRARTCSLCRAGTYWGQT